jgi:integrase
MLEATKFPGNACTANCALRTLRRILNRAREDKLLAVMPKIRCRAEEPRTLVLDDVAEVKLAPHLPQNALDVIRIMRDCGGRNGEVLSMRWEFVDWERGCYSVPGGKTKAARRRFPPLSNRVLEILDRRHLEQGMPSQGWVFPNPRARTGHLQSINAVFAEARKKAGLPKELVPYCARHDAGSFLMERTGNPKVVMELLGHRQVSTTMRYTHLREEQVASLRDAINDRGTAQKLHKPN